MNNTSSTKLNELKFYVNTDKSFFIRGNRLLDNNYKDIAKLLKLDEKNPVLKIGDNPTIILEPYFDDDGQFYCSPLTLNLQDEGETQQNFLKIMYDKWLLKKPKSISISETHWVNNDKTTIVKYNTENIQLAIGFLPKYSVLH